MRQTIKALSLCVLAGIGLWSCRESAKVEDSGLHCKEHGVPEKFCTLCHAELKEKLLLCTEHGNIPEDICTQCHPEAKDKYGIVVCAEHGLPQHFCVKCEAEGKSPEASASGNLINDGWRSAFGDRAPDGKTEYCELLPLVRLASAGLAGQIGLGTSRVGEEERAPELTAYAEAAYDGNRYAAIAPSVSGILKEAKLDVGAKVSAGDILAVIDSAELGDAKAEYIANNQAFRLAETNHQRVEKLLVSGGIAAKEGPTALAALNQARVNLRATEQRLHSLRFDEDDLATILRTNDTKSLLPIVSPIGGAVVGREAVAGMSVETGRILFTVADTTHLWLWINVYEENIDQIRPGQKVTFTVSGNPTASPNGIYSGDVTWAGAEVDEKTRTAKVRAAVANPDGKLRAHQVGRARIKLGEPYKALTVPKAALQRYENVDLVFLTQEAGAYRPQRVKTKPLEERDVAEVTWGLKPGQEVVVAGAFLLKTEIMKGSIGAGCCD